MKVITIGMGEEKTINKFRGKLTAMASKDGSGAPLVFEANFNDLDSISNNLVEDTCGTTVDT